MASINGITIKTFKTFRGVEYPECREAIVWKGNKKLGMFSEDGWGGPPYIETAVEVAVIPCARQFSYGCNEKNKKYEASVEVFIEHVLDLAVDEKIYKSNCKKGYPFTLYITNGWKNISFGCKCSMIDNPSEPILKAIKREYADGKYKMYEASSLDAFNITVDASHPVPEYLKRD